MSEKQGNTGIFGKMKGMIFEEDSTRRESSTETVLVTETPIKGTLTAIPARSRVTTVDEKTYAALSNAVFSKDTPYAKFLKILNPLKDVIVDEATRFKAAYKVIQSSGVSLNEIIGSVDVHASTLEREGEKFSKALEEQNNSAVGTLERQYAETEESLTRLRGEITKLEAMKSQLEADISIERAKVETVKSNFEAAYELLHQQLENDKNKLTQHLKGGN